jgi:hypothetical protein
VGASQQPKAIAKRTHEPAPVTTATLLARRRRAGERRPLWLLLWVGCRQSEE